MKSTLKAIGLMVIATWFAGLSLYYGKRFPLTKDLAAKATEGFGQ